MAATGKAGTSSSGASMSKYDVEVEARLQALEKAVAECKECCKNSHSHGGADDSDVGARLDALIAKLSRHMAL